LTQRLRGMRGEGCSVMIASRSNQSTRLSGLLHYGVQRRALRMGSLFKTTIQF
jgi:hypothetical protein